MRSAAWFAIEVIAAVALIGYVGTEGWSWWLLLTIYPLSAIGLAHLVSTDSDARQLPFDEFTLDSLGPALTGRDADNYAGFRARLTPSERRALDALITSRRQATR